MAKHHEPIVNHDHRTGLVGDDAGAPRKAGSDAQIMKKAAQCAAVLVGSWPSKTNKNQYFEGWWVEFKECSR